MQNGIHFISGLPRSGSTLLSALLRQNPRFHAEMSSPVAGMYMAMQASMSGRNEFHVFIKDHQRRAILKGIFENFYHETQKSKLVFDTNRAWCSRLSGLVQLFPQAKIICCVRSVAWVIDSIERLIQRNAFEPSKLFNFEAPGSVYTRTETLTEKGGMIRGPHDALQEAFHGENAHKLLLVQYESLSRSPASTLAAIYDFIGEESFKHDFENVEYSADDFDDRLGTPGLHRVARKVELKERQTILPPDIFMRFAGEFWKDPARNVRNVRVI